MQPHYIRFDREVGYKVLEKVLNGGGEVKVRSCSPDTMTITCYSLQDLEILRSFPAWVPT